MSERLRLGVRVDREGHLLEDFHTVVGGVLSADGKIKKTASTGKTETIVSHRHYLCDASFLAALQGREDLIERASASLQNPVWPPFLGRRSCVPSRPFWAGMGDYETLENALIDFEAPKHSTRLRLVVECEPGEGVRRSDQVVSYPLRTYASRYVRELLVDFPSLQEAEVS